MLFPKIQFPISKIQMNSVARVTTPTNLTTLRRFTLCRYCGNVNLDGQTLGDQETQSVGTH